jgi:hypothetical protein
VHPAPTHRRENQAQKSPPDSPQLTVRAGAEVPGGRAGASRACRHRREHRSHLSATRRSRTPVACPPPLQNRSQAAHSDPFFSKNCRNSGCHTLVRSPAHTLPGTRAALFSITGRRKSVRDGRGSLGARVGMASASGSSVREWR